MDLHIIFSAKAFPTMVTAKRTSFEMNSSRMAVKTSFLTKLQATLMTCKRSGFVMGTRYMAIVTGNTTKALATQSAFNSLLRGLRGVSKLRRVLVVVMRRDRRLKVGMGGREGGRNGAVLLR